MARGCYPIARAKETGDPDPRGALRDYNGGKDEGRSAMAICKRLKEFLDGGGVRYVTIEHSPAYTAQEVAQSAHVPGRLVVKSVVVQADGKRFLVATTANQRLNLEKVALACEARHARLDSESDLKVLFGDCEVGAMPPFGNLYDMPVVMDPAVWDDREITFNAGSHTTVVRMAMDDYVRLAKPRKAEVTGPSEDERF
jgi:Ala-tRNA(Pro) deacylase